MYFIQRPQTDPYFNLAAEEYLLKTFPHDCLMLWRNNRAIVIGKHQNTFAEINTHFVEQNQIPVIRRISGGGTVFHDPGNVNFSFISKGVSGKLVDFRKFADPIIQALSQMGLHAKFEGKNDLRIKGLKISGNAEHVYKNKVLHHGTLLFNSKLDSLSTALRTRAGYFVDKAVQSNRSEVANINDFLKEEMSVRQFLEKLQNELKQHLNIRHSYSFSNADLQAIQKLANEKYKRWEWNYGYSPKFKFTRDFTYERTILKAEMSVDQGMIVNASMSDPTRKWDELLNLIQGERFDAGHISRVIKSKLPFEQLNADLLNEWMRTIFY